MQGKGVMYRSRENRGRERERELGSERERETGTEFEGGMWEETAVRTPSPCAPVDDSLRVQVRQSSQQGRYYLCGHVALCVTLRVTNSIVQDVALACVLLHLRERAAPVANASPRRQQGPSRRHWDRYARDGRYLIV